ncbi:MAG: GTP-binding protein [Bacteroidales bacterium]|nr:GTP-binding protein [Bacteroidales bacterium]
MNTIPVLLLTGYLGSGKTTLVNRILSNRKGIKFAVIVNDIGEVNIDADLIEKDGVVGQKDDSLMALSNGCICCTLKMDLVKQLTDIVAMHKFDYIVIEASGICEPEPIARTICSIPFMGEEYIKEGSARLDCIVTVVDARRMRDEFACAKDLLRGNIEEDDIENLVIQQVEFCNIILLNKASEVSREELGKVREIVRTLQPKAEIIECDFGEVDFDRILNTSMFDYDSVAGSASWITEVEKGAVVEEDEDHDDDDHDHDDDDHGHHHHHDEGEALEYGIGTYVYLARKPFDINKFDNFIARHWPAGIIRAKGMCYFTDDTDKCYIFEQAGTQISMKEIGQWYATMPYDELQQQLSSDPTLRRDWDPVYGDRMQKLVFIGQHLDKQAIKDGLDFCLVFPRK